MYFYTQFDVVMIAKCDVYADDAEGIRREGGGTSGHASERPTHGNRGGCPVSLMSLVWLWFEHLFQMSTSGLQVHLS